MDAGSEYCLTVDLPGVELDDVQLAPGPVAGTLSLTTRIRDEPSGALSSKKRLLLSERTLAGGSRFARIIPIAPDADVARLRASVTQGVLTVNLPKVDASVQPDHV